MEFIKKICCDRWSLSYKKDDEIRADDFFGLLFFQKGFSRYIFIIYFFFCRFYILINIKIYYRFRDFIWYQSNVILVNKEKKKKVWEKRILTIIGINGNKKVLKIKLIRITNR